MSGGGGYTIHLSYRVVVEEVILLLRFYCHPQSQLGIGIRGLGLGLDNCLQNDTNLSIGPQNRPKMAQVIPK